LRLAPGRSIMLVLAITYAARSLDAAEPQAPVTMDAAYPGLVSGVLVSATLGDLPEGVVLRAGKIEIATKAMEDLVANSPRALRAQLRKNVVFLLDELAGEKLLFQAAADAAAKAKQDITGKTDKEIVAAHLESVAAQVQATEAEIAEFHKMNLDAFSGASLDKVRPQVEEFVLEQKRGEATRDYIRGLGKTYPITVSAPWVKENAAPALDNPVDKARVSGLPSVVDFGASGCRPCDLMAPMLKALTKKLAGKANVVFVHVRKEEILAARYGITTIPTQIFFDKDGKAYYHHVGFFPQDEIEKKLAEAGSRFAAKQKGQ